MERLKNKITKIQEEDIGYVENNRKQERITEEIMDLIKERRKYKINPTEYKHFNKVMRKKCRKAKENWRSTKCRQIEYFQERYDTFNVHKEVKEMTGRHKKRQETILRNNNNEITLGIEDKLVRWEEYTHRQINEKRPQIKKLFTQ